MVVGAGSMPTLLNIKRFGSSVINHLCPYFLVGPGAPDADPLESGRIERQEGGIKILSAFRHGEEQEQDDGEDMGDEAGSSRSDPPVPFLPPHDNVLSPSTLPTRTRNLLLLLERAFFCS